MKKLIYLIAFIAVLIVLSGCVEEGSGSGNGSNLGEMQVCGNDFECIFVDQGCCGCSVGGKMVSINKSFLQQYSKEFLEICTVISVPCQPIVSKDPSCSENAVPVCKTGKCGFKVVPQAVPTSIYYQPMQCEGLPWIGGEKAIPYYFENYDIEMLSFEEVCENIVVCQACSVCPTQCHYQAEINQTNLAKMLELGWTN